MFSTGVVWFELVLVWFGSVRWLLVVWLVDFVLAGSGSVWFGWVGLNCWVVIDSWLVVRLGLGWVELDWLGLVWFGVVRFGLVWVVVGGRAS